MTEPITHPIGEGTCVRLTRDIETPYGRRQLRAGVEFIIEDYEPAMAEDDPRRQDPDFIHEAHYEGTAMDGISPITAWADAVEIVRTAEQQNSRTLPSLKDLGRFIGGELLTEGDGFEMDESDYGSVEKDHHVELYGSTDEGLRFALIVEIKNLYRVDF